MIYIRPIKDINKEISINGDKSITQRAILLAAVTKGESQITGVDYSLDVKAAISCARTYGARIEEKGNVLVITGVEQGKSGQVYDCENSATTMRLLVGILVGKNLRATLIGDESLTKRPMRRIAEPLNALGGRVETTNGCAPIEVYPSIFKGGTMVLDVPSAQVKSGILLAGVLSGKEITLFERIKTRDHTEKMLLKMGANLSQMNCEDGTSITIKGGQLHSMSCDIPRDISSAAYYFALGALRGKVVCKDIGINPTRVGIFKAFDKFGIRYILENKREINGEEVADVVVEKSSIHAIEIGEEDIPFMIDEVPIIALLCAYAKGISRIYGLKELKIKESNRLVEIVKLITALGGKCVEENDGIIIYGKGCLDGGDYFSNDHRMIMTAAIGMACSKDGGKLGDEKSVVVSFPQFFNEFDFGVLY